MTSNRRDLSAFLVHLTRNYDGKTALENLISVIAEQCIEARNPHGVARAHFAEIGCDTPDFQSTQLAACFSETPIDDLHGLIDPGVWRACHFEPYGVVFTRKYMLENGANPVWYLNSYAKGGIEWPVKKVNRLIDEAALNAAGNPDLARWKKADISRLTPLMDVIGKWPTGRKDFSFEREWRHHGDFVFSIRDIETVFVRPGKIDLVRAKLDEADVDERFIRRLVFKELEEREVIGK